MKKTAVISLFIFLGSIGLVSTVHGQFGIKAGLNFSDVSVDTEDNLDIEGKTGFHFGVFFDIGIADILALRPGAIYNTKGFKVGGVDNSLNYFDIPLNLALKFGGDQGKFVIEGGPYFGLFLDGDADGNTLEGGKDIETTELGYNGGIAYETNHWGLGINYKQSLTDLDPMSGLNSFSAKNNIISVFVLFKL